ncbi:MAG TPA: DISARM system helicase DrmA [Archangium sp.]|nr:DISARM system helicase DrmA [Archangium sp.]
MTSVDARDELVRILEDDLIGPKPGELHAGEILDVPPSRFYLTGFLIPTSVRSQALGAEADDEPDLVQRLRGGDDEQSPERGQARRAQFPSSLGLTVLVPHGAKTISVEARWGEYAAKGEGGEAPAPNLRFYWHRTQRVVSTTVPVDRITTQPRHVPLPGVDGVQLSVTVRPVADIAAQTPGTRCVSIFLVNGSHEAPDERREEAYLFQAGLTLGLDQGFEPRLNLRGLDGNDEDEKLAAVQYRDCFEFAVGHAVAARSVVGEDGRCREVHTTHVPSALVERLEAYRVPQVELSMEALAAAQNPSEMRALLAQLPVAYAEWIHQQRGAIPTGSPHEATTRNLFDRAEVCRKRIEGGLDALSDPLVFEAFRLTQKTMAAQARRREAQVKDKAPADVDPPSWRTFQLAFVLMNLRGVVDPRHADRGIVDLLFFPTGGGKTEAYLGLAAFTLLLRRLRDPSITSAGVTVLMRYTLRLLTLDQLGRASALICALELERQAAPDKLGKWPFEIGLWVGLAATPNKMGKKGDDDRYSARARTLAYQRDDSKPPPLPLEKCPWCGHKFSPNSFRLSPNPDQPQELRVVCMNRACDFTGNRSLPLLTVDEPIYRRLPCFLIATVDKFAQLPWLGPSGALFGKVDRHDATGFYGPTEPGRGTALTRELSPPDLVIQDELHLISGPLGTMVGLYETAIDALAARKVEGQSVLPKVVASTATVRRADRQIQALFGRSGVDVFPPPGPNRRDSFFAKAPEQRLDGARRYVGIAAQGRSPKVIFLRASLALLAAAQRLYDEAGGDKNHKNPVDPYMTLLGYFNSLRELGGSRRIVEDEVSSRVRDYGSRKRVGETVGAFKSRKMAHEVVELTSREHTTRVADTKRRLELPFHQKDGRVDVALATNMISVGLDITRLGLMVVFGQPKTAAEYIQATSRVGRNPSKPGLVVTLLNLHKPRDRSHYERFEAFHASFYRSVEATSVTPFSPRAIDRGAAGVTVTLARHLLPGLTPAIGASAMRTERTRAQLVADLLVRRAVGHDRELTQQEAQSLGSAIRGRVERLLDIWARAADENQKMGVGLQYFREHSGEPNLLFPPLDPEADRTQHGHAFTVHRSLRDVEPAVNLWVKRFDGRDAPLEEDE